MPSGCTRLTVAPGGYCSGSLRVPGDKSISHRAVILAALAEGMTEISGFLEGEDNLATVQTFRAMGVPIEGPNHGQLRLQGVGLYGLKPPAAPLYLGNSGTSMRLMAGLLAGQRFATVLTGDSSLSRRPMRRVTEPLTRMGAHIDTTDTGTAPLHLGGNGTLTGIDYHLPMASAQVKSSLLLAGLYAAGTTRITEPAPTRDHTERMLSALGWEVKRDGNTIAIDGKRHRLQAIPIDVPADLSSAAFFLVGASIAHDSELHLLHVGINPTRSGVIDILRLMGAHIEIINARMVGAEPVADLLVQSAELHGIDIPTSLVPLAIDEFPALFIAAACAKGTTTLTGAAELRVKESDRIEVMAHGLTALGIHAAATADGIVIRGGELQGGHIDSHGDHRIAMAFAMAALRARAAIEIDDCANIDTSFPDFLGQARSVGLRISAGT